eukprot:gnl/TRDRNA2_/TRDRNA2_168372_c1_seq1.p1 gnl/TRDRNA2_/TRDRNA2_168372_c1~~gnl/TRDRNA2_/TRDRNA2_168372_c1_seq1.p1  ORF type:complete len:211 (+),score=36.36 gnl/TRDRNA2_/TRDRNA2_168372_c1_seq1:57-635(+)
MATTITSSPAKRRRLKGKGPHLCSPSRPMLGGWASQFSASCKDLMAWVQRKKSDGVELPSSTSHDAAERSLATFLSSTGARYRNGQLTSELSSQLRQIPGMNARLASWDRQREKAQQKGSCVATGKIRKVAKTSLWKTAVAQADVQKCSGKRERINLAKRLYVAMRKEKGLLGHKARKARKIRTSRKAMKAA